MTTPEQLANQMRALCEQIDQKADALRKLGYTVNVGKNDDKTRLAVMISKTTRVSL